MIIVNPIVPLEMVTNLDKKPEFEKKDKKKESSLDNVFKSILHDDMRARGSTDPEQDIIDYQERRRNQ